MRRAHSSRRQASEQALTHDFLLFVCSGTLSISTSSLAPTRTPSSRDLVSAALTTQDLQRVLRPLVQRQGRLTERVATLDKVARALFNDGMLPALVCVSPFLLSSAVQLQR